MSTNYTVDIKVKEEYHMKDVEINDLQEEVDKIVEDARKEVEDLTEEKFNKRFPDGDFEDMGNLLDELEEEIKDTITFDVENDESDEETYIEDVEYEDIDKLIEVIETLNADDYIHDKLVAYTEAQSNIDSVDDLETAIEECEDMFFYPDMTMEELAEQMVDEGLFGEVSDSLVRYIDFESLASELEYDYTETSRGIVRFN